ncbi:MAG: amino acid ABC transporter substrate-binding protein [Alphaproteobacteria bacterium]|nr:MAG: amino acid ABC transporter substrate-binding protein [Alphaproteobacteria bacterium]
MRPYLLTLAAAVIISWFLMQAAQNPVHHGTSSVNEAVFQRVAATKTIRCGYFTWPPYITKDPNTGKLSGINYDIMEAIGKNLGLKIEWAAAEVGVGDAAAALEADKFDVMCASIWVSPGRGRAMTFTNPTFYSDVFAFARADDTRFDGDLGKANNSSIRVVGIDGDYSADMALEKLPNATPVLLPSISSGSELMLQLASNKADIFFSDKGLVNDFAKTNPGKIRLVEGVGMVRVYGESLAVRLGEYKLRDLINISILQLTNDGVIEKIVRQYAKKYDADMNPPQNAVGRNK